jgi:hypothetical protein
MTKRKPEAWRFDEDAKRSEKIDRFKVKLSDAAFERFVLPDAKDVAARALAICEAASAQPSADDIRCELSSLSRKIEDLAQHFERRAATGDAALLAIWRAERQLRRVYEKEGKVAAYPEYTRPSVLAGLMCPKDSGHRPAALDEVFEDLRGVASELRGFAVLVDIAAEFPTPYQYKSRNAPGDPGPSAVKSDARSNLAASLSSLWESPQWSEFLKRPVPAPKELQDAYGSRAVSFGHKAAMSSNGKPSEFQAWSNALLVPFKFPPVSDAVIGVAREHARKSRPENE